MKKFTFVILSLLAVCLIFTFGCDTADKNVKEDNQITYPLSNKERRKFSREGHLKNNEIIKPHMPDRIPPHLKSFPR